MQNKICIYAICKDEIKFLDKWLDSMSEADYIVVLDTGSTDGTYERLKSDPRVTKVRQKTITPWRFDVARNESLKLVPKDANILLCTDLDERFDPGWGDIIRKNWTEHTIRGHYRYIWSHTETGAPGLTFWYDKMHTKDYKWYYPVHEVLGFKSGLDDTFSQEAVDSRRVLDLTEQVTLHHYPDNDKSRSNYFDLLQLRFNENPNDCYSSYLLGREYGVREQYDEALRVFEQTLNYPDINHFPLVRHICLGYMGDIYAIKNNLTEAIVCYTLQIQGDYTYREPYVCLGEIYNQMGMHEVALAYINEALKRTFQHYDWTERSSVWNEKVDDVLSVCYYNLGDLKKALTHVLKALKLCPSDKRLQDNYLRIVSEVE